MWHRAHSHVITSWLVDSLLQHNAFFVICFFNQCVIKQLLELGFVIFGRIKVSVSVIRLILGLRLITLTSTLIIPNITETVYKNIDNDDDDGHDYDGGDEKKKNRKKYMMPEIETLQDT